MLPQHGESPSLDRLLRDDTRSVAANPAASAVRVSAGVLPDIPPLAALPLERHSPDKPGRVQRIRVAQSSGLRDRGPANRPAEKRPRNHGKSRSDAGWSGWVAQRYSLGQRLGSLPLTIQGIEQLACVHIEGAA